MMELIVLHEYVGTDCSALNGAGLCIISIGTTVHDARVLFPIAMFDCRRLMKQNGGFHHHA